ncbi:amino acid adenylation domain-containing protein, partial [Streptomyces scopuliridis]
AFAHQDVPFERVVEAVNPTRSLARHPLFQTMLAFNTVDQQQMLSAVPDLPGLVIGTEPTDTGSAMVDLRFSLAEATRADGAPAGLVGEVEYAADLFEPATAERFAHWFTRLLDQAVADPRARIADLALTTAEEAAELAVHGSGAAVSLPEGTLVDRVADTVRRVPDAVAVTADGVSLTFAELDSAANRMAWELRAHGVGPEMFVAVSLPRTVELVVALLAILRTGAAYVPLDPDHPSDRLAFTLADTAPALLVTRRDTDPAAGEAVPRLHLDTIDLSLRPATDATVDVPGGSAAYMIYTSGSTGRPKGVVNTHAGLGNTVAVLRERFRLGAGDRLLSVTTIGFDIASLEVFLPLSTGATLVMAPAHEVRDARALACRMRAERDLSRTLMVQATPSHLNAVLDEDPDAFDGLRLLVGGEALRPDLADALTARAESLSNGYGPTEAAIYATMSEVTGGAVPDIGGPLGNTSAHVLDAGLRPLPVRVPGELYVAGAGLARGYHQRPALSAQRFVANPYGPPGSRLYRTGDVVRRRADGRLDYLGRVDDQVKVRGFRIELGEVESVLLAQPGVRRAVVTVREDVPGDRRLVAHVVADPDADVAALRGRAARALPDYMVPSVVMAIDTVPLTPSGKVDRRALPAPVYASGAGRAPRTAREEVLCALFAEVLGVAHVGIDDDFFELGGHSLLATALAGRIRSTLRAEVTVRQLFDTPTPAGIAGALDPDRAARPPLLPRSRPDRIPLSYAQQRLWFLHQLDGPSPTYNIPTALRLTGTVDVAALDAALQDLVARHESLRTVIGTDDDGPFQMVRTDARAPLTVVDGTDPQREAAEAALRTFDLAEEIPVRAWLLRAGEDEHVVLLVIHHIAGDGWSLRQVTEDLVEAYRARVGGQAPDRAPLPVQYADFTLWQRELLGSEADPESLVGRQLAHWTRTLAGLPDELVLHGRRPRPDVASHRGEVLPFEIPADLHAGISRLAAAGHATPFMVIQAALAVVLQRAGAGDDIPIGTIVAGRTDDALARLVGFFVNTLVLRTDVSGSPSFTDLLYRVRETCLAAYSNQDLPFERLVEVLNPDRSRAQHPLYQVELIWQEQRVGTRAVTDLDGLSLAEERVHTGTARLDLAFSLFGRRDADGGPAGVAGQLLFATDLYDARRARRIVDQLTTLLEAAVERPDTPIRALPVTTASDEARSLALGTGPERARADRALAELFEEQAERTPDHPASVADGATLTYRELNRRADALATRLTAAGAGPDTCVGVLLPRSAELLVALVAVLKTGAAYLPLDAALPAERIALILADLRPVAVVTTGAPSALLPTTDATVLEPTAPDDHDTRRGTGTPPAAVRRRAHPDHSAYVIYTSGSTGRPKGVVMTGRALLNLLAWHTRTLPGRRPSRVAQFSAVGFDVSVQEMLGTLLLGDTLLVCPEDVRRDPAALADWLHDNAVTDLLAPALVIDAVLQAAADNGTDLSCLRTLAQAGEQLAPRAHVRAFLAEHRDARLHNHYGPAETHVVSAWTLPEAVADWPAAAPIGLPVDNTRLLVLDERLRPVAPTDVGELYIGGAALARGYHDRPALTAQRFVADPYGPAGSRLYRTGDLARWNEHGVLEFLGRADDQIKVRGQRVELGEIEHALSTAPEVAAAAVVVREDRPGDQRVVGYVVAAAAAPDPAALRERLRRTLPEYMVPAAVVLLDALPLTSTGKLDRRGLPAPDYGGDGKRAGRPPRGAQEEILCGLFAEVLNLPSVRTDDNFFACGGHSMLAAALVTRVRAVLSVPATVRMLFDAPTPAELAVRLTSAGDDPAAAMRSPLPLRTRGTRPPLFCVHPGSGASWVYAALLPHLDADQPVHGLQAQGLTDADGRPASVEEMAADYVRQIREVCPDGPYRLLGWSFGGHVAHAAAVRLAREGATVELLAILDAHPEPADAVPPAREEIMAAQMRAIGYDFDPAVLARGDLPIGPYLEFLRRENPALDDLDDAQLIRMIDTFVENVRIMRAHRPDVFEGDLLFASSAPGGRTTGDVSAWQPYIGGRITEFTVDVDHEGMLTEPAAIAEIGRVLRTGGCDV